MRGLLTIILIFCGTTAAAHPGHWGELIGHDHWVAGAAIGLAAIWGALNCKKQDSEEVSELDEETA